MGYVSFREGSGLGSMCFQPFAFGGGLSGSSHFREVAKLMSMVAKLVKYDRTKD